MNQATKKQRRQVLWLTLLFMAPILLAMWLRFADTGWRPEPGNHGDLIEPPVHLQTAPEIKQSRGYWLMVQLTPASCHAPCRQLTDALRRVRVALGKDAHRVKHMRVAPGADLWRTLATRTSGVQPGAVFLVDPRNFLMMRYAPGFDPNGLLDDLEKLLRYSKVGVQ